MNSELPSSKIKVLQTNPNELRMNSSLSGKCPLVPCVAFPEKLSQSFHSLERVGERSAFIISVCRILAFKANARSSVWAPQREVGLRGGGIIGRGRTDPGAVPGSPGRGRKQDSSAVTVGNLGLKEGTY